MSDGCCCGPGTCNCSNVPENKMCKRETPAHQFDIEGYNELTFDLEFICKCHGRTVNDAENLFSPASSDDGKDDLSETPSQTRDKR